MNSTSHVSAAVLLCLLWGCATGGPSKTESTTAPGADIAAYASFGWPSAADSPSTPRPPLSILDANIHASIRRRLLEKGYREVAENPDLLISFETAAYVAEKVSSPVRIGVGVGSWGGNVGGGVSTSVPVGREGVVSSQEIRLTIRAVDPKRNQEVWVGTTTGISNQGLDAVGVDKAVADTLAEFPARPK